MLSGQMELLVSGILGNVLRLYIWLDLGSANRWIVAEICSFGFRSEQGLDYGWFYSEFQSTWLGWICCMESFTLGFFFYGVLIAVWVVFSVEN